MKTPEFASHWARELGSRVESLVPLRGGVNNHVFRCASQGCHWVIKGYGAHQPGQRDRMQAEVEFLRYANQVAPRHVPELISVDPDRRCVVLEHIEGSAYPEGVAPTAEDLQAAVEFFRHLNADLSLAKQIISLDAAEGFLSLRQHIANVRERLSAMGTEHLPAGFRLQAAEQLGQLQRQADRVETELETFISAGLVQDRLDPEHRCISPSDFGFHNAIRTDQGVSFIDFEFAGWDDPAKASADFILQPRIPTTNIITPDPRVLCCQQLPGQGVRFSAMKTILTLKWQCIILAVLNSERLAKMVEVNPWQSTDELISARLAAAILFNSANSNDRT